MFILVKLRISISNLFHSRITEATETTFNIRLNSKNSKNSKTTLEVFLGCLTSVVAKFEMKFEMSN